MPVINARTPKDITGRELNVGDYVVINGSNNQSSLAIGKILKFTSSSVVYNVQPVNWLASYNYASKQNMPGPFDLDTMTGRYTRKGFKAHSMAQHSMLIVTREQVETIVKEHTST